MKGMENEEFRAYEHLRSQEKKVPLRIIVGIVYLAIGLLLYLSAN